MCDRDRVVMHLHKQHAWEGAGCARKLPHPQTIRRQCSLWLGTLAQQPVCQVPAQLCNFVKLLNLPVSQFSTCKMKISIKLTFRASEG
jgi:hypothetical protein